MEFIELNATKRTSTGKGAARKLRQSSQIPAILYGQKMEPELLALSLKDLDLIFRQYGKERLFFNLTIEGNKEDSRKILLKELQEDIVTGDLHHADLQQIDLNKPLHITVPVVTTGISQGVEEGGLLQLIRRKLEIICLPEDIPDKIEVDVSPLKVGESIHVSELILPSGATSPYDTDYTIVTVLQPKGLTSDEEEGEETEEEGEETEESKEKES